MPLYYTVHQPTASEYRVKSSRFFGRLYPVNDLDEIKQFLHELQDEYKQANHYCYAYRLLTVNGLQEFSTDAGEPGGSAGRPILNVLMQEEIINAAIIVVRYFGGTKLGIPGLIEAYGHIAGLTLASVEKIPWIPKISLQVTHSYPQQRIVEKAVEACEGEIVGQVFTDTVCTSFELLPEKRDEFDQLLTGLSNGQLTADDG